MASGIRARLRMSSHVRPIAKYGDFTFRRPSQRGPSVSDRADGEPAVTPPAFAGLGERKSNLA